MSGPRKPNALIRETSPYLLQHACNPVDWHPWGEEALGRARQEDKPILLSIGYSACHWCHVMERESFENEATARLMNEHYVNIKVDREERPDLDTIYMSAVQIMTGHGGWPMTVFLTPDLVPFYGGTYFPPDDRHGMPGFPRVLLSVARAWRERRAEVRSNEESMSAELRKAASLSARPVALDCERLDRAAARLMEQCDREHGGFGGAPKFPSTMALEFLLRSHARTGGRALLEAVEHTLRRMALGGIYDQLGGGFHRYSVDSRWLVPHFEKMLYDNALLSRLFVDAHQATGDAFYRRIAEETLEYVRREMTSPEGGFYSTQDADSEGHEGKFFLWDPEEVRAVLGERDAELFCRAFDVTEYGNFEGKSILNLPRPLDAVARLNGVGEEELRAALQRGRRALFEAREERVKPGRDEKILAAWNGLMMRSFAEAARAFARGDLLDTALRNAEFVLGALAAGGRLRRTFKDGKARLNGYLEDYACVADGLLSLHETTTDPRWLREAEKLAEAMERHFLDEEAGDFYFTPDDHERLPYRPKDPYDNATPSGNSVAAHALLRLGALSGEARWSERGRAVLEGMAQLLDRHPLGFGNYLCAADRMLSGSIRANLHS